VAFDVGSDRIVDVPDRHHVGHDFVQDSLVGADDVRDTEGKPINWIAAFWNGSPLHTNPGAVCQEGLQKTVHDINSAHNLLNQGFPLLMNPSRVDKFRGNGLLDGFLGPCRL